MNFFFVQDSTVSIFKLRQLDFKLLQLHGYNVDQISEFRMHTTQFKYGIDLFIKVHKVTQNHEPLA